MKNKLNIASIAILLISSAATLQAAEQQNAAEKVEKSPTIIAAEKAIQANLLLPLKNTEKDLSPFSRRAIPPKERRIRTLALETSNDNQGSAFVPFAVDDLFGTFNIDGKATSEWSKNAITGCVYPKTGEVFIARGKEFYPAALLLGKRKKAAQSHICR